jgi:multiple sugar transport system ATP-binding protein
MAQVVLENVSKIYPGGIRAVKSADLTIQDAEFVVLVGPSGCGKTTTLRMIAGLEEISEGTVSIGDRVVNAVPPKDRDIAMVFQNYALYPHMSVYNNMAFGLKLRKFPKADIKQRVTDAAKVLGIENLLERKPKALSGGQRQRVALGRAIVRQPKAFLFDEPLSNLDAKLRVEMRAELKKLHRKLNTTTVYVTHDQEEAMTLGDRVVVMKDGVVQQVAAPLDIYNRPVNKFVAGFMGMPPMNFFNGRILFEDGNICFEDGTNKLVLPGKWKDRLSPYKDQATVLGIRPENFAFVSRAGERKSNFKAKIEVTEPLGNMIDVYMTTPNHPHIVARVDAQSGITEGAAVEMYVDVNRVHVFETGDVGKNVTLEPGNGD